MLMCGCVFAYDPNSEPNLMLFYQFDSSLTTDSQGNYNGYASGSAVWSADVPLQLSLNGQSSFSADLSAADAYIQVLDSEEDFNLQSITVALWMKGAPYEVWRAIVSKFGEDSWGWQFRRGGNSPANLAMTLRGLNNADGNSNTVPQLVDGNWHHYAASHDAGTATTKYFIDGALFQTITGRTGTVSATTAPVAIGTRIRQDGTVDGSSRIPGLDDVRIYGHALTDAEIMSLCPSQAKRAAVTAPVDGFLGMIDYANSQIAWNAPLEGGAAGYNVWIKKDGNEIWEEAAHMVTTTNAAFPASMEQNASYQARVDVVTGSGFIIAGTPVSWYSSALPTITKDPVSPKDPVKAGSNYAFYCTATDPLGAELIYTWYVNGQPVPSSNSPKFIFHDVQPSDHASEVYCQISSANGSDQSTTALLVVESCIARYTFNELVDNDPNHYDPNFPNLPIGIDSRYGYDCTLVQDIRGLSNTTGPDGSNALVLDGTAALVSNVLPDSNLHFRDYSTRVFLSISLWMKGFPTSDSWITGMETTSSGYGLRKLGNNLCWTTRDHDKDGDMQINYLPYASDGKWHHIVVYFGPNDKRMAGNGYDRVDKAIFIDGVRVATADADCNRPGIGVPNASMLFAIGCHAPDAVTRSDLAGNAALTFAIDDLRVYNYALDTTEIAYMTAHPGANPECMGIHGDTNGDCTVNLADLTIAAQNWLVAE